MSALGTNDSSTKVNPERLRNKKQKEAMTPLEIWELMKECLYPYPNITDSIGGTRRLTFLHQDELLWFIQEFQPEVNEMWITTEWNIN